MIATSEFRNGSKLELDGEPFTIIEFQHVKPGKGGAFVRTKLKSLRSGNVIERTYRSGEKLETPDLVADTIARNLGHDEGFHVNAGRALAGRWSGQRLGIVAQREVEIRVLNFDQLGLQARG